CVRERGVGGVSRVSPRPVLRVPPGLDYDTLARPGEVEVVSLDGVVREAVLWPVELASVQRRATVLHAAAPSETVTSADPEDARVGPVDAWIVDPDPAVTRAHLVRHWAARHGMRLVYPHLAQLTRTAPSPHV